MTKITLTETTTKTYWYSQGEWRGDLVPVKRTLDDPWPCPVDGHSLLPVTNHGFLMCDACHGVAPDPDPTWTDANYEGPTL
jgi:hypothetical protein